MKTKIGYMTDKNVILNFDKVKNHMNSLIASTTSTIYKKKELLNTRKKDKNVQNWS